MNGLHFIKKERTKKPIGTRISIAAFFIVLLTALPLSFVHAASSIDPNDLSTAKGWSCSTVQATNGASSAMSCRNTDGSIAHCDTYGGGGDGPGSQICTAQSPTGAHAISSSGGGQTATVSTNSLGQTTQTVDSPVTQGAAAIGNAALSVVLAPIAIVSLLILFFSSWILGIVGVVFNFAVVNLVFNFAHFIGNSPGMLVGWGILRDFGNIALLFGFIFMGIATILDLHSYAATKTLPRLIIFAVLLNFSLLTAEAVIDVSNVFASALYNSSYAQTCAGISDPQTCAVQQGISGEILQDAGISTIFGTSGTDQRTGVLGLMQGTGSDLVSYIGNPIQQTVKYLGLSILVTTTWVVLLAGAVLLISRGVQLAFLMVTSPAGFAGMAIPPLAKMAQDWWKRLFSQSFFAPVYLLLIFVGLKITDGVGALAGGHNLAAALTSQNAGDIGGPLLIFALVIGFMVGSLLIAKQFGIVGAEAITKTATGAIGGMSAGAIGLAYRSTAGSAANRIATNIRQSRFGTTFAGQAFAKVADVGATASFDLRGKNGLKAFGADFGKPNEGAQKGRRGELDAAATQTAKDAEELKKARDAQDKGFKQTSTDLQRKEDLARANAAQFTTNDPTRAEQFTTEAEEYKSQRAANEKKFVTVQDARLTTDDKLLRQYYPEAANKAQVEASSAKENLKVSTAALEKATGSLKESSERLAGAMDRMAEIEEANRRGEGTEESRQEYENLGRAHDKAWVDSETARAQVTQGLATQARAQTAHEQKAKTSAEAQVRARSYEKKITDPKYAMEQYAQTLTNLANTALGRVLDPSKLRAGVAGIRREANQSKEAKIAHDIQHLLENAAKGGEHKEEHAAEAPKSGGAAAGGGASAPHADSH